ncbi:MAG: hypothetical protein KBA46_04085 [Candidatus Omnitrophica bacterium]|nr:hypothetical protein [Candidatus Omnitrophota bacterium]
MRRVALVALVVLALAVTSGYAATDQILEGMGQKAVRGVVNIVTSPLEVPMQILKGYDKGLDFIGNEPASRGVGAVLGIFRGIGHAAGRLAWGGLELVGFWTANPADNVGVGIPFDAEYAWQEGQQYSIFKPDFEEGIKPVTNKLAHGVADALLGIAEVPSQVKLGKDEGNAAKGFVRGLWFWASREVYGFGNVLTCIVPNPTDNPGYSFNTPWPWTGLTESLK